MNPEVLPNPKYPLAKYSSKRLLEWLERAVLSNCLNRKAHRENVTYQAGDLHPAIGYYEAARQAAIFGRLVCETLNRRGFTWQYLDSIVDMVEEDVLHGN